MNNFEHGSFVGLVIVGIAANFGLSMENNDSRLLGVRKSEFIQVMRNIVFGGKEDVATEETSSDSELEPVEMLSSDLRTLSSLDSPRSAIHRQYQKTASDKLKKRFQVKRDSLYFLQKSLESREKNERFNEPTINDRVFNPIYNTDDSTGSDRDSSIHY